jgi:hypothetical protein
MLLAAQKFAAIELPIPDLDLDCRRWHSAKLRECSVSPALSCISFHKLNARPTSTRRKPEGERQRRIISARKVSGLNLDQCNTGNAISQKLIHKFTPNHPAELITDCKLG